MIRSDDEYLHDGENLVHINCYRCSNCQQSLAGKFYYRYKDPRIDEKRKIFCESCYYRLAPICYQCLKIIDDISLIYGERIFHPSCFLCYHCQKAFKGTLVFPYENQVYCSKCYSKIQKHFHPMTTNQILSQRCEICRKKFEPGDLITKHQIEYTIKENEENKSSIYYIHNSCFVCEICHENLSNTVYYSPNNHNEDIEHLRFQCQKCHDVSPNICSNCFTPSDDIMIIFNNRWYHDRCFKCKICGYKLKDLSRIITESDGLLCERCLKVMREQQLHI